LLRIFIAPNNTWRRVQPSAHRQSRDATYAGAAYPKGHRHALGEIQEPTVGLG
jgi:hypothetical protein